MGTGRTLGDEFGQSSRLQWRVGGTPSFECQSLESVVWMQMVESVYQSGPGTAGTGLATFHAG